MIEKLWTRIHLRRNFNPTRIVVISFALIILTGTLLLMLPVSSKNGESASFLTSLFTSTSATCVTGLVVVDTWSTWTLFGQIVILGMIQLGGLGFMTAITLISFVLHRKITLSERLVMASTLNLQDVDGVVRVVRHALIGTAIIEGIGATILSICFIPEFGLLGGIWRGIFHAVSAFCNAGFDILGSKGRFTNMTTYTDHPVILITIMSLIVIGGLGFFVWEDLYRCRRWKTLSFYSKMVLTMTAALIVGGAAFFFFVEYNNPATLGTMPALQKAVNAFFQSITLRTAGFNTIDLPSLTDSSKVLSILWMLIGGSSGSTAGGIKTGTFAVLLIAFWSGMRGREQVAFRGRSIPDCQVANAMTLVGMVGALVLLASMTISLAEHIPYLTASFEVASAMGTVGLSLNLTPTLHDFSRVIIIILMYLGRVGILSVSIAFITRGKFPAKIKYPAVGVIIG